MSNISSSRFGSNESIIQSINLCIIKQFYLLVFIRFSIRFISDKNSKFAKRENDKLLTAIIRGGVTKLDLILERRGKRDRRKIQENVNKRLETIEKTKFNKRY